MWDTNLERVNPIKSSFKLEQLIFQAFGLHPNADITYQTKTAVDVLDTIVNIQPKDSSTGGGETRESVVARQATEMLEKLPDDYISHEVFCLYSLITFVKHKQHEI